MLVGCIQDDSSPTTSLDFDFSGPPPELDEVVCEDLLDPREIQQAFGVEPSIVLKDKSSCFWLIDHQRIQLVINTSPAVATWTENILTDYTVQVTDSSPVIWRAKGEGSLAIFADDRGMLVHGIRDRDVAVDLLRLAFSRLR